MASGTVPKSAETNWKASLGLKCVMALMLGWGSQLLLARGAAYRMALNLQRE